VETSVLDQKGLAAWCERWLGARPVRVLFASGHLAAVYGLRLTDGREVVVKIRPTAPRVSGCVEVQRFLCEDGFPCPSPLTTAAPLGEETATAEEYVPGGMQLERSRESPTLFAKLLWQLINRCVQLRMDERLSPAPPWVAWDHKEAGVWPLPDGTNADLNAGAEPCWLDELAGRTRDLLLRFQAPVVGHLDWESQNIRWRDGQPLVVHDWDSVAARPEATVAGAASAVFTSTGEPGAATLEETEQFLDAYQRACGHSFTHEELAAAWAAGLWVRAFNAKKIRAHRPSETEAFADEAQERLRRATG
jgi:Phosphotransferase enzyme family